MSNNGVEIVEEIVTWELLDFRRFHVDVKNIKNLLQWWEKHEFRFPIVGLSCKANIRDCRLLN
jgi:hypothetical protein